MFWTPGCGCFARMNMYQNAVGLERNEHILQENVSHIFQSEVVECSVKNSCVYVYPHAVITSLTILYSCCVRKLSQRLWRKTTHLQQL